MYRTEIVDSPDDGGFWISQWNPETEKSRASEDIYPSKQDAVRALLRKRVRWEEWR